MPNALILMKPEVAAMLSDEAFARISSAIADAIGIAFGFESKGKAVAVYDLVVRRTWNAGAFQVICLVSESHERRPKMVAVRNAIGAALLPLMDDVECAPFLRLIGSVESWVVMPPGSFEEYALTAPDA